MAIDYSERIPNNVNLAGDKTLQRALEHWQPAFLRWWEEMGPSDFNAKDVYLRTAVNVGRQGWAHFGRVVMKDYRWGIFLAERDQDRRVGRRRCPAPRPDGRRRDGGDRRLLNAHDGSCGGWGSCCQAIRGSTIRRCPMMPLPKRANSWR